jgi:two-component system, NarL family, sensor histidine kinase DesK
VAVIEVGGRATGAAAGYPVRAETPGGGTLSDQSYSDRMVRLVTVAPMVVLPALVGTQLALTAAYASGRWTMPYAVLLMAYCLPACMHHAWHAAHGRRPPGGRWTLAGMAAAVAAGMPLVGSEWLTAFAYLLASTVIVLRRQWAIPAGAALLAGVMLADLWLDPKPNPLWIGIVVMDRAGAVLVLCWLAGALRELRAAREELAARAVLRERIRIDGELAHTVGASLVEIAARGAAADELAGVDPAAAEADLRVLVDGSRRTAADARRLISGYQRVSLRAELDTAVALLTAAGVPARLVAPRDLPAADPRLSAELRSALEGLLRGEPAGDCVLTVDRMAGELHLEVEMDGVRAPAAR